MFDMLVEQNSRVSPLTPRSSPPGAHHQRHHVHHHPHHPHLSHHHHHHHNTSSSSHLSPQTSHSSDASSSPRDDTSCSTTTSTSGSHSTPRKGLLTTAGSGDPATPELIERGNNSPEHDDETPTSIITPTANFSALQRLQFALEKNSLFSTMYESPGGRNGSLSPGNNANNNNNNNNNNSRLYISESNNNMVKIPLGTPTSSDKSEADPEEEDEEEEDEDEIGMYGKQDPMMMMSRGDIIEKHHLVRTPTTSPNGSTINNNPFQCPLCSINCSSRHQFNEHLVSHSQQHACPKCSFLTNDEDTLRSHLQDSHDIHEPEMMVTDEEVRVPKVNSQGKLKTFKCKQCEYKAVIKKDFWEHCKSHMRQEKMLTCPKCPFVTEYKHHLEYHLRNHFGSKPFQCDKCAYSCVNKSMLNSHLKSHSNVYQYRCRDCTYATKYCHSLKLHLRKYSHNPSVVLNLDGTPNPLPIIDVYGTRRGPKIKRSDPSSMTAAAPLSAQTQQQQSDYNSNIKNSNNSNNNLVKTELKKRCNNKLREKIEDEKKNNKMGKRSERKNKDYDTSSSSPPPSKKYTSGSEHSDSEQDNSAMYLRTLQLQQQLRQHSLPDTPVTPGSMGLHGLIQNSLAHQNGLEQMQAAAAAVAGKNPLELYAALNQYLLASNPLLQMIPPLSDLAKLAKEQNNQILSQFMSQQQQQQQSPMMPQSQCASPPLLVGYRTSTPVAPPQQQQQQQQQLGHAPLDLRNPKASPTSYDSSPLMDNSSEKRKRKGKAFRYHRTASNKIEPQESNDVALDFSNNNNNNRPKNEASEDQDLMMRCKYCDISFPDKVLYSMHMSYHSGDGNPFLCKSCGKKTQDKISFYRHLTTDSH